MLRWRLHNLSFLFPKYCIDCPDSVYTRIFYKSVKFSFCKFDIELISLCIFFMSLSENYLVFSLNTVKSEWPTYLLLKNIVSNTHIIVQLCYKIVAFFKYEAFKKRVERLLRKDSRWPLSLTLFFSSYPEPGRGDKNPHFFDILSLYAPTLLRTSLALNNLDLHL